ncbi:MAG: hypothetical protein HS117_26100 [Verrucomicrobiaceae bacterium]|nr:hypothetical protein [Verrucomicrobiaceae bacterium]
MIRFSTVLMAASALFLASCACKKSCATCDSAAKSACCSKDGKACCAKGHKH